MVFSMIQYKMKKVLRFKDNLIICKSTEDIFQSYYTCDNVKCILGEVFDYLVAHGRMKEKEARAKFRQV